MVIAVDLGGTNTRVALFSDTAVADYELLARFKTQLTYQDQLDSIVAALNHFDTSKISGIGLAIGVQLTSDGRCVDASYTMPDFVGKPIAADLFSRLQCPVIAANDNICGVLAESQFGYLGQWQRVAYVTVSTGTGAGVYLRAGETAVAYLAQVGHHIVDPLGKHCRCGQIGCLQTISGALEITQRSGRAPAEIDDDLFWDDVANNLAVGIVNFCRISRVEALCVGGGIGFNNHYLRENLAAKIQKCSPNLSVSFVLPLLGEDAPLVGANLLVQSQPKITIFH